MKHLLGALIILFSISSCVTRSKCAGKFPCPKITDTFISEKVKTVEITVHDTIIKGETAIEVITPTDIKEAPVGKWIKGKKTKSGQQISYMKDSSGALTIDCTGKDIIIQKLRERISAFESSNKKTVKGPDKEGLPNEFWYAFWFCGGVLLTVFFYWAFLSMAKLRDRNAYRL